MKTVTRRIVLSAMLAALVCVATMLIQIPTPMKGYVNLGDCIVLLAGWLLSPVYGFLAAGFGSAMADMFSGYVVYAPATFVIKGAMALLAWVFRHRMRAHATASHLLGGALAELWMVIGYFLFEGFLYGFSASVLNVPANAIQGAVGLSLGLILARIFKRNKKFFSGEQV